MKTSQNRLLRVAAVCAIAALVLMIWPMFDSRPIPIVIFMSVGQAVGTLSLLVFLYVVFTDLRRTRLLETSKERDERVSNQPGAAE